MNSNSRIKVLVGLLVVALISLGGINIYKYGSQKDGDAFGEKVRAYLLENPKLIREVIEKLQVQEAMEREQQKAQALAMHENSLTNDGFSFVAGNPDGDVTIVEFFDYRCGYCKRSLPDLMKTVADDGNIRLVLKELPILGEDSVMAARAAMASIKQGKYMDYHIALMQSRGGLNIDKILGIAEKVGLNVEQLAKDMEDETISQHIQSTYTLANSLNITGTPAFVIGNQLVPGAVPQSRLVQLVAEVRKQSKDKMTN